MATAGATDSRGFFIIPSTYEGGGYYVYGRPGNGQGQYAHPKMMSALLAVARHWSQYDTRKFGIGNISLADGMVFHGHSSHRSGLDVDIRPLRKDGRRLPCLISSQEYDRDATTKLIELFRSSCNVKLVLFNDPKIPGVKYAPKHYDHFHVQIAVA